MRVECGWNARVECEWNAGGIWVECGWNAGGMQHVCYLVSFRLHNDVGMGHLWRVAGAHSTVGAVQMPLQTRRRGRYAHARNAGEMRVECGAMPGGTPHTCSACDDDALSIRFI